MPKKPPTWKRQTKCEVDKQKEDNQRRNKGRTALRGERGSRGKKGK